MGAVLITQASTSTPSYSRQQPQFPLGSRRKTSLDRVQCCDPVGLSQLQPLDAVVAVGAIVAITAVTWERSLIRSAISRPWILAGQTLLDPDKRRDPGSVPGAAAWCGRSSCSVCSGQAGTTLYTLCNK